MVFKRKSVVSKRIKKIQQELSVVDRDLRSLSRSVRYRSDETGSVRSSRDAEVDRLARNSSLDSYEPAVDNPEATEFRDNESSIDGPMQPKRDERLAEYLSGSFQSMGPLRHERRIQRNKAVVMCVVVILILFWAVYRFFL